jgi:hypothetical protein
MSKQIKEIHWPIRSEIYEAARVLGTKGGGLFGAKRN